MVANPLMVVPHKVTELAPVKLEPQIVKSWPPPMAPYCGEIEEITGPEAYWYKAVVGTLAPPGVVSNM